MYKEFFKSLFGLLSKSTCCNKRGYSCALEQEGNASKYSTELSHLDLSGQTIGLIAGNGLFPLRFIEEAKANKCRVVAVCFVSEANQEVATIADEVIWIKLGEFGKLISFFKNQNARYVAMAGGINRVKWFGGVKLDTRGAALLLKVGSAKDDAIMRGVADELFKEGIEVIPCTTFLQESLVKKGLLTDRSPTLEEQNDIKIGISAIQAMSSQHIGQVVVVREGVIVAVEAVEGTDNCILRGGELGGVGSVVVKFSKPSQDMRFDVPTVGIKTIESMIQANCKVLALESNKSLLLDRKVVLSLANKHKISIVGI